MVADVLMQKRVSTSFITTSKLKILHGVKSGSEVEYPLRASEHSGENTHYWDVESVHAMDIFNNENNDLEFSEATKIMTLPEGLRDFCNWAFWTRRHSLAAGSGAWGFLLWWEV